MIECSDCQKDHTLMCSLKEVSVLSVVVDVVDMSISIDFVLHLHGVVWLLMCKIQRLLLLVGGLRIKRLDVHSPVDLGLGQVARWPGSVRDSLFWLVDRSMRCVQEDLFCLVDSGVRHVPKNFFCLLNWSLVVSIDIIEGGVLRHALVVLEKLVVGSHFSEV